MAKKDNGKKNNFLSGYVAPSVEKKKVESKPKQSASSNAQNQQRTTNRTQMRASDPVTSRIQNDSQKVAQRKVQTGPNNPNNPNKQKAQQQMRDQKSGIAGPKDAIQTRVGKLTEGAVNQQLGGLATTWGRDTNDANEFKKYLDQGVTDGKWSQEDADKNWNSYINSNKKAKKDLDWKDSKGHEMFQALEAKGQEKNAKGDKQIEEGKKGLGKGGQLAADAYTSALGMLGDMATGPAWALSMASRTYGNTINSTRELVDKGIITEREAEMNALGQAAKETGTEYVFKGAGLAKGLKGVGEATKGFEKALGGAIDKLTSKIDNKMLREIAHSAMKNAGGIAEEATEELLGGIIEPGVTNLAYANKVDKRNQNAYRENLIMGSTDLQRQVDYLTAQGYDRNAIINGYAGQIANDEYKAEIAAMYMENGFSEKQANKIASGMQEYMLASLSGDEKAIKAAEDKMVDRLGKYTSMRQHFSASDTLDAMASAALMVGVTGGAGSIQSSVIGADFRKAFEQKVGKANATSALLNTAMDLDDADVAARAQAMKDNGGQLANQQWYDLGQAIEKQTDSDRRSEMSARIVSAGQVKKSRYFAAPDMAIDAEGNIARDENGNIQYSNEVANYRASLVRGSVAQATEQNPELVKGMDEDEQREVAESIEKIALGFADVSSVNNLTLTHPEARALFEQVTGETLPSTNKATREFLFNKSIENYVDTSRAATIDSVDVRKGSLDVQYSNSFGGEGQSVFSELSSNVDMEMPENFVQFASVAGTVYDFGRQGASMEDVLAYAESQDMSRGDAQKLYDAGVADAEDSGFTVTYDVSEASIDKIKNSDRQVFLELAKLFGVNIVISDNLQTKDKRQANGSYDEKTNTLYLNLNDAITKNIGYTITHELTHRIKLYNKDAYEVFAKSFKERAIEKNGQEWFDEAIKERIERYRGADELDEDGALEEIIADQMGEILHDREFIENFVSENTEEAQTILSAIRDIIRKITQLFAVHGGFRSDYNEALLSELGLLREAEMFFANSIQEARSQQTQEMLEQQINGSTFNIDKSSDISRNGWVADKASAIKMLEAVRDYDVEFDPKSISLGTIPTVFTGVFNIGALDVIVKPRHLFNSLNSKSMAESKIKAVVKDEKKQKELLGVRNSHYHEIPVNEYYEELKSLEKPIAIFDAWDKTNKKAKPRIMMLLQSGKIAVMDFYSNAEVFGSNERRNHAVVTLYQKGDLEKNRQKDNKEDRDPITVTKEYIAERMSDLLYYNSSNDTEVTRVIIPNHNISSELLEDRLSQFNEKLNTYKKNRGINYSIDASTMSLDAEYEQAVESDDYERAQELLNEAAVRAGAETNEDGKAVEVYHGTLKPGFEEFRDGNIYFSDKRFIAGDFSAAERFPRNYSFETGEGHILPMYVFMKNPLRVDASKVTEGKYDIKIEFYSYNQRMDVTFTNGEESFTKSTYHIEKFFRDTFSEKDADRVLNRFRGFGEFFENTDRFRGGLRDAEVYKMKGKKVKLSEPSLWNALSYEVDGKVLTTTDDIADYAKEHGYDGVVIENVIESVGRSSEDDAGTDYIVFNSNNAKSAEIGLTDAEGKLIPLSERFNLDNPNVKYSLDSEGRELTPGQQEFFKESKIRDENGQLLVVYHGTDAEFDVFKNTGSGHYFTANPKYAERYGSNVRAFYLNIVKPFDVTQDSVRDDFVQFVRDGYSNSLHPTTSIADIYKAIENGIDWTEADNLIEWIEENELDYDGLVIDEGGDLDENGEVFDRGNSYVSFNSNQAKLTSNENPTENESVKFSMDAPYEETKELIAVHNVKESDIAGLLKLQGIPMPSIAVIKAAQGHDMYGEYSFIFGKDTIDPAKNKANKVYGGDAWTPVFPTVEYEVKDDKAFDAFRKKIAGLTSGARQEVRDTLYGLDYTDMFNDKLRSNNGLEKFKEALLDDTRMMQVFLDTKGQYVDTIVKKEEDTMSPAEVEKHKFIIDKLGEDVVRASVPDKSSGVKIGDYRREYLENNGDAIKQAYKAYGMEIIGLPEAVVDQTIEGMNRFELFKIPRTALQYLDEGPTKVKETPDYRGTEDAIREKTDEAEYKKWLDDLFGGLTIQEGLYNGKDYYTPSGDRRSFKDTHMDATLNNIVKAMKLHENGETMLGHSFKAVAQKKYDSIADIKADSKRLEKMSEEEYSEKNKEFADRESKIIDRFFDDVKMGAYDNPFIIRDTINTILVDSIRNAKSSADVLSELKEYPYTKNATKADADAIWQLVEDVANMPTGYFEAKPERAVTFDEVQAVIAPDNAPSEIIDGLKEQNVDVVTYEAGNEEDRKDKLNSLDNAKFSIDAAKVDVSKHKTVKLSKKDYAIVYHSVVAKNASVGNSNEHLIDYTFTDNLFVMYETWGDDSFRVFMKKSISGNEDYIQEVTDGFREDAPNLDSIIESVRNRRRRRSRNNADASGRGAGETDGGLDRQESNSIEVSDSNAGSRAVNERVELTPVVAEDAVIKYSVSKSSDFTSFIEDCLEGDTSDEAQARRQKSRDEIEAALASIVRKDTQLTYGKTLNRKSVKKPIKELVFGLMESSENTYADKMDAYYYAMDMADAIWHKFYNKEADLSDLLLITSRELVEDIKFVDDDMYNAYNDLRRYMRNHKISVPEFVKEDISWADYRKKNFGRMLLTTESGFELDKMWHEISPMLVPFVDATEYTADGSDNLRNVEDMSSMFLAISDALDNTKAYRDAYADAFAQDIELQFAKDLAAITIKQGEAWESFADKKKEYYETRAKEMQARHKVAMRELREQRDKKLAEAEQKRKDDLAKQKQKYEERDEKRKAAEREKKEKQKAKKQDHRARMKAFGHIETNYNWLTKRLLNPKKEDDQHIPEGFISSLARVLAEFDMQSQRSLDRERLMDMYYHDGKNHPSKPTEALRKMREELQELSKEDESGIFVYNGALFSIMDKLIKSLDGHPLRDVNTEDLEYIDDMLASIKHMIQNENKLFADSKKEAAASAGESIIEDMGNKIARYKRRYDRKGVFGGLDHLLNEDMMTPMNFFKALGGQMHQLYKNLRYGQDDYIRKIDELRGFFDELFGPYRRKGILGHANTGSAIYDWSTDKSVQTFKLASGEEIQLSVAQMMSLYCHSKREQSMKHILGSGVVVSDVKMTKLMDKVSGKVDVSASGYRMTYDDVVKITDALTDEQKEIAQKIQELMNGKLQEWGNETSMQLYGIRLFKEKNYFPIAVNNEDVPSQIGKASGVTGSKISNFGFTKDPDPKAANRLIIADIFEVVSDHANKMALYSAYAAPLTDFNRVLNYKQKVVQQDEQGNTVSVVDGYSVKGRIKDAYGSNAISFINNFLNDVNGQAEVRIDGVKSLVDKSLARVKKASIGANLRVLVQQPTAIVRAAYYINPIYFANPSEMNLKKNIQEMHEHCPIAAWKAWGNYQNDFTRGLQDIITNNGSQSTASAMWETATMGVYGMADDMTWGMIWGAVKNEVKAKHPTVKYGSEEFWILCNERASLVFDETQVVDSVFHRSDVMRSKDGWTKTFSSFMAEPTRTYNMMRSSVVMSYRLGKDGKYKEAAGEMAKALAVFTANAAAVSAAAALVDALRGKGGDDDDEYWELWYKNYMNNFTDNLKLWNNIVYAKDVLGMLESGIRKLFGDEEAYVFQPSNMVLNGWYKLATGLPDTKAFLTGEMSIADFISGDFVAGLGYITGVPAKTIGAWLSRQMDKFGVFATDEISAPIAIDADESSETIFTKLGIGSAKDNYQKHIDKLAKKYGGKSDENMLEMATDGYRKLVDSGDFSELSARREAIRKAGGDVDAFDEKIHSYVNTTFKKTIGKSTSQEDFDNQQAMKDWMLSNGWTEQQISDVVYRSDTARDFKAACRMLDHDAAVKALTPLLEAGLTEQDIYKLWNNRNRGNYDTSSTGTYVWGTDGTITSGFGNRGYVTAGASSYHQGIDIGAEMGTKVVAADGGVVTFAGNDGSGYGNYIIVTHDNGTQTYYGHLSGIGVRKGQRVSQSQPIGNVGSTGVSTGPHLHFAMKINGSFVDPSKYIKQ
ncbi:MAG: peptidoglycan DD-metalloendopeptidase family protein [Prevotella sp.]|nr:peptidoglycan DD-metalloendopeptidase family protein [Prevotella sp.]